MLLIPKKFFYALEAVAHIAFYGGEKPVGAKEICEKYGLAPRYLEPIMQHLVHSKILRGVRGPKGGYFLARERRKVTAGEILLLIQGMEEVEVENPVEKSAVRHFWKKLGHGIQEKLDSITLDDLCKDMEEQAKSEGRKKPTDFVI